MAKRPLKDWSRSPPACTARICWISAHVKSLAKKPSSSTPSTTALRLRLANCGNDLTLVVAIMFGS
jgi:hypothetical protein